MIHSASCVLFMSMVLAAASEVVGPSKIDVHREGFAYGNDVSEGYEVYSMNDRPELGNMYKKQWQTQQHSPGTFDSKEEKTFTYTNNAPVPYPDRNYIRYPVEHKVPYPVSVEKKVSYVVEKRVPHSVLKYYSVPVEKEVEVPYPMEKKVYYPVHVEKRVPVPYPVEKRVPYLVKNKLMYPVGMEKKVRVSHLVPVDKKAEVPYPIVKHVPYPIQTEKKVSVPRSFEVERKVPVPVGMRVPYSFIKVERNVRFPYSLPAKVPAVNQVPYPVAVEKAIPVYVFVESEGDSSRTYSHVKGISNHPEHSLFKSHSVHNHDGRSEWQFRGETPTNTQQIEQIETNYL